MPEFLRLGDHCLKIGSGATPRGGKDSYLSSGPYRLIRSQNVYNSGFSREGLVSISEEQAAALSNAEVLPGDILLNITGDSVARTCQVDDEILPARVNQHVAIIRPDPRVIDPRFLRFYLVSPQMQSLMLTYAGAGATRNALTKGMIENFKIPRFHIAVQRKIGATLGVLEDKIELNRRMNETLEAMAQAIFRDWFVDFGPTRRKLAGITDPVEIMGGLVQNAARAAELAALFPDALGDKGLPGRWRLGKLGELAQPVGRPVSPDTLSPDTPYIGLEHMPRQSIALDRWGHAATVKSGKLAFQQGDFLFGKLRPYFHKVGIAPLDGICSTDIVVLNAKSSKARVFVICCISQAEFVSFADRTSDGTKMPRTSWSRMEQYEVCIPSDEALSAFNTLVEPLLQKVVQNIHLSRTLASTRDLLLPKLMSGEIRLREAQEIAEAVP